LLVIPFTKGFASVEADRFIRDLCAGAGGGGAVGGVTVGHEWCFGKGRSGNLALLQRLGAESGFRVNGVEAVRVRGEVVSSTRIRALISLAGMSKPAEFYEREFDSLVPGKDSMWDEPDCPLSQAFADDMKSIGSVLPAATSVTQPWLLIHGAADDLVPVQDGKDAFSAAVCRKQWLEIDGAGHSFDEMSYPRIIDVIDGWLRAHFG
jgi:pimeloyl-ACP methyl ester carboxylesterase